jgi:hypothetical protein
MVDHLYTLSWEDNLQVYLIDHDGIDFAGDYIVKQHL